MRLTLRLCLLALLLFPCAAFAGRTMEVQNIRIEERSGGGRDVAVALATKQAAEQVWQRLGKSTPLPDFSPAQLQSMASYVDISNEVVHPNFYGATFNIGIDLGVLGVGSGDNDSATSAPAQQPDQPAVAHHNPTWVLIVPVQEYADQLSLWDQSNQWVSAWNRAPSVGISTAAAGGDAGDQQLISAERLRDYNLDIDKLLRQMARKYDAPAVAMVTLSSQQQAPQPSEEVQISVTYLEPGSTTLATTAQSTLFITPAMAASAYTAAVAEGQKLIHRLANPGNTEQQPPASTLPPSLQAAGFGNTSAAATSPNTNRMWVRIPLSSPTDLANYRRKIEEIPNAQFEIITLNRMYVEGNIIYPGDRNALLQQLAARGLYQQ